jgi:predicted lipid-binding transport protein (Tim44 family)
MQRNTMLAHAALAALTLTLTGIADAKRMGGGGSLGVQRSIAPQKSAPATPPGNGASPTSSTAAAAPAAATAPNAAAATPAPAPAGMSRWLGPIAGIAAGLGLAALVSHFGLADGFGTMLLLGLVLFAGSYMLRRFLRRRAPGAPPPYAGASAPSASITPPSSAPSWRIQSTTQVAGRAAAQTPTFGVARKTLPQDFDAVTFAKEAKHQYIQIQRSYDDADRVALSSVMTAEMAMAIGRELDQRSLHQPTEIVTLDADVLDVSTEDDTHWVSVRFTGLIKEDGEPLPHSIDEVWNLAKPVKGGSGWLLAGISQLA